MCVFVFWGGVGLANLKYDPANSKILTESKHILVEILIT